MHIILKPHPQKTENPFSWTKPTNNYERIALATIAVLGSFQPIPLTASSLGLYLAWKATRPTSLESAQTMHLPAAHFKYHPHDLKLPNTTDIPNKLKNELIRAQMHLAQQEPNPRFDTKKRTFAPSFISALQRNQNPSLGIAHAQGPRPTMEDAHVATLCSSIVDGKTIKYELFGIIDGHGGEATAKFVASHIKEEIEQAISKYGIADEGVFKALKEAFVQLDSRAKALDHSGAVAVITLKIGSQIWTANLGDCRAILKIGNRVIQLSEDAKPNIPRFRKGIEKRGGFVANIGVPRVNGVLAVARAFNDHTISGRSGKYAISPRPKITKIDLEQNKQPIYLIQACDGIWDVASSKQVGDLTNLQSPQAIADAIVANALKAGSTDNCSALVSQLH